MTRFSAAGLDLSRFPAPLAIRGIDYEAILAERKTQLVALFAERGVDIDIIQLETDTSVIIEEADAYRELLTLARINDAVRAVMVAFAVGADLEHLAAFYGVARLTGENDTRFRLRTLLAPEAYGCAGTHGSYVFFALTADPRVKTVDVWSPRPGEVIVAVQEADADGNGIAASTELLTIVRDQLTRPDVKPLTDMVTVRSVINVAYSIKLDAYILPGPDHTMVKSEVLASVEAMTLDRATPSRDVPRSAVFASASVGPVDKVIVHSPVADIARDSGQVGVCTGIDVRVIVYAG